MLMPQGYSFKNEMSHNSTFYGDDNDKPLLLDVDSGDHIKEQLFHKNLESDIDVDKEEKTESPDTNCFGVHEPIPSSSVTLGKEQADIILREQLKRLQAELNLKDIECSKLQSFHDRVSLEVEELTASLFEEANRMVNEEKVNRHRAEKALLEANMKLEGLLTETAWRREQASTKKPSTQPSRSTSLQALDVPSSSCQVTEKNDHLSVSSVVQWFRGKQSSNDLSPDPKVTSSPQDSNGIVRKETDPIVHREFVMWREKPSLSRDHALIQRIYQQDILPAFEFSNVELAAKTLQAVENNLIFIEEGSKYKPFSKTCSLSQAPRLCFYRMKINDEDAWYPVSFFARNRVISVCDFVTYVRYIQQGLVRRGVHDTWWEIVKHREKMALARLGLL